MNCGSRFMVISTKCAFCIFPVPIAATAIKLTEERLMKNIITACLLIFIFHQLDAQVDTVQIHEYSMRLDSLTRQKQEFAKPENDTLKSSSTYKNEINEIRLRILNVTNDAQIKDEEREKKIKDLQNQIEPLLKSADLAKKREEEILSLTKQVNDLDRELGEFKKYKELTETEAKKAELLIQAANKQNEESIKFEADNFVGNVEAWSTFVSFYVNLAKTSESILIFDEKDADKFWGYLKSIGSDVGTVALGGAAVFQFTKDKNTEGGWLTLATVLVNALPKFLTSNTTMENITRNIAFSDEIRSISAVSGKLEENLEKLKQIMPLTKPEKMDFYETYTEQHLQSYSLIIGQLDQLHAINFTLVDKANYLLKLGKKRDVLTQEGETTLKNLIDTYDKNIKDWDTDKPLYIERYNLLMNELRDREKRQTSP